MPGPDEADRIRLGARLAVELYRGPELTRARDPAARSVSDARTATPAR